MFELIIVLHVKRLNKADKYKLYPFFSIKPSTDSFNWDNYYENKHPVILPFISPHYYRGKFD